MVGNISSNDWKKRNNGAMRQAQDIVWNSITESAKRKFDYTGFRTRLSESGDDDRTAEYILFQIVVGYAEGLSAEEILSKVSGDLQLFACSISEDELVDFLADKRELLAEEVHAAKEALSGFAQGGKAPVVLAQVKAALAKAAEL